MPIVVDQTVLFGEYFTITFPEQIALRAPPLEVLVIHAQQTD
jgi:hypothetical protein